MALSKKKSFILFISMIVSSSVMLFLFAMTLRGLEYVFVTGSNPMIPNKEIFVGYLVIGLFLGTTLFINGVKGLWRGYEKGRPRDTKT